jgi:SHS2 domain-containing protein
VKSSYRFVEHMGEVELALEAASEAGIFEAALAAFAELVATGDEQEPARRELELRAGDHALLLVDWLNELVFLAEVEGFVPERVAAFELAENCLRATIDGRRNHPRQLVKAVTLATWSLREKQAAGTGVSSSTSDAGLSANSSDRRRHDARERG